ncbi:uncharacterized protein [Gossypium hirsutum]|uniref:SWIM-type domain-containing protein n=1 Tax=Gossypium hirsutum TaxID=3635 RepID=A0A1U8K182_GOSHI|nr:uncharacterized protein LOC107911414 [Gossypium hirsutum]
MPRARLQKRSRVRGVTSCSCRNWDLTSIPCMHALVFIHLKMSSQRPMYKPGTPSKPNFKFTPTLSVRGPKQWVSLSNMLSILPPTLRKPHDRPTKVRRKEPDEPQTTERLSKRGVDMRCSKCKRIGHNKRSCKWEVGQNIPVKRHKVGVHNQVVAPTQRQATPNRQ